jgi:3'-phosphoadenosine 5'-phosphosulfate sulfotransferase (PAPS reductase)/FAD synthetase
VTTPSTAPGLRLADYDLILINSSAGKDSQTALRVVCQQATEQGVLDRVTVLYCDLGRVVWPGTSDLAARQAAHYGVRFEIRSRTQNDLLEQVRARGMWPSSAARYCTSDQKRAVARKLITELVRDLPLGRQAQVLNVMGLRGQESRARAKRPELVRDDAASSGVREVWTWLPIHNWTEDQVWADIKASGVPYHPVYDQGMSRLSCSLCVLASKPDLIRACQLRPELAREYADLEDEIDHRFRADMSMADLMQLAGVAR